jgi:hypothetical protein
MSNTHWTASDLGVRQNREDLINFLNGCRPGSFMSVHEYMDEAGRVTDKTLRLGIKYANVKAASLRIVEQALLLDCPDILNINVNRAVGVNGCIMESNRNYVIEPALFNEALAILRSFPLSSDVRKRKGVPEDAERTLTGRYPNIPRNLIHDSVFFAEALIGVREGIVNPQQRDTGFSKDGQSTYSHDEAGDTVYLRDVLVVTSKLSKDEDGNFINQGEYAPRVREQNEVSAIKDAIKDELPIGNYRAFILKGHKYKSIVAGGQAIAQEQGDTSRFWFILPEVAKELLEAPKESVEA